MVKIQLIREAAFTSDLIAWFSHGGGWSHVDAVSCHGQLWGARNDTIHIDGHTYHSGFHIRPCDYALFVRRTIFEIPATKEQEDKFWRFLTDQIGKPYDWTAIWGFAFDRDWRQDDAWICSEAICAALEHSGILPQLYLKTNRVTPRDVALVASAIGGKVILDESHMA